MHKRTMHPGITWKSSNTIIEHQKALRGPQSQESHLNLAYISSVEVLHQTFTKFSELNRALFLAPLINCLDKLVILSSLLNVKILEQWKYPPGYRSLFERFSPNSRSYIASKKEKYEGFILTDPQKVQKDVTFITCILGEGCWELHDYGSYSNIINTIKAVLLEHDDDLNTEEIQKQRQVELHSLKVKLVEEKDEFEETYEAAQIKINTLSDVCEDIVGYAMVERNYTDKWEATRQSLNNMTLFRMENFYTDDIQKNIAKIDYESRIHTEIENFLMENTEDLQNSIAQWVQKYDEEMEQTDSEMLKLKISWEQVAERHSALKEKYNSRNAEIEEYLNYKEQIRLAQEEDRRRNAAATIIQAFWRGTMVRRKLGPYKPQKKEKKSKKKGKKTKRK